MLTVMGMIFFLSHQPGNHFLTPRFPGVDIFAHVIAYGSLAATTLYALQPLISDSNRRLTALAVLLFCLVFGIGDEFHQSFIPHRYVSAWDVVADLAGAILVVACWYMQIAGKSIKDYS